MINVLRVDIRRYLMTKTFVFLVFIISVILPVLMRLIMLGLSAFMHKADALVMVEFSTYSSMADIYIAVFVTMFLHAEAGEGIIRNKLISGKKRYEIFISYCMVNAALAVILQGISVLVTGLMGVCTGAIFEVTFSEIMRYTLVSILAGIAISVLYTSVYLCFCTCKAAIVMPACVAIFMRILLVFIEDAIYTSSGIPKVTGITLKLYEGFDRYVSFAHLTGELRWDNASYLIGNLIMIVISMLVGVLVFRKKDMK